MSLKQKKITRLIIQNIFILFNKIHNFHEYLTLSNSF